MDLLSRTWEFLSARPLLYQEILYFSCSVVGKPRQEDTRDRSHAGGLWDCSSPSAHPATSTQLWLHPSSSQRLISLDPVPPCVASAPCPRPLCLSPWQQLEADTGYGIWILCPSQTQHRFVCKNQAGIFQHWHQLVTGFQKRDFFHLHVIKPY